MTIKYLAIFALGCGIIISNIAYSQNLPFFPQPVDTVKTGSPDAPGLSRLKVSLTVSQDAGPQEVLIGNVSVCSNSACYRPVTATKTALLYTTKDGHAETISEFAIPRVKILSVHFESIAGAKTLVGSVDISNPIDFDEEYFGEDVLVVVKKMAQKKAVNTPLSWQRQAHFIHPREQFITTQ